MERRYLGACWVFSCALLVFFAGPVAGQDCSNTSVGFTPINDLGSGLYLGQFQGGFYPGGLNTAPSVHHAEGLARAAAVEPLDAAGSPSPTGKYVLVSIGMSNTTQEFCSAGSQEPCDSWTFMGQAAADPTVNMTTLSIVNGARGGQAAGVWVSPSHQNYELVEQKLIQKGLTEAQVQVLWIKQANPGPQVSLPNSNADAYVLMELLGDIVRAAKIRYPNLKIAFLSSRIYAGYAPAQQQLNPEPYAYETAFSVKWLIEAQINQMSGGGSDPVGGDLDYHTVAPWLAWGPYFWADGLTPRGDGLIWECSDLAPDGTHPATDGETKVGTMILDFMHSSPYSNPWFAAPCSGGDPNDDGSLDGRDINTFIGVLLGTDTNPTHITNSDMNCDGSSDMGDINALVSALVG